MGSLLIKAHPLINTLLQGPLRSGLWLGDTRDRTVPQQSAINKGDFFFFSFPLPLRVCVMLFVSFVIQPEFLPSFLPSFPFKKKSSPWHGLSWGILTLVEARPPAVKRHHYYQRLWSWHLSPSNGGEMMEGRMDVEVSRRRNGTIFTALKIIVRAHNGGHLVRDTPLCWNGRWKCAVIDNTNCWGNFTVAVHEKDKASW